jgi:hypothetical protein
MDQVAPGFRERFDQLLAPEVDTQLEAQLQATAQQITQLSGRHAQLLITPEHLLDAASRQMKFHLEAQQAELVSLYEKLERKKMDCERKQVSQATDLAASFLRRLRHHQPSNQVSGGLSLDAKALERLRKDGLSEQEVSGWFQQFHHQVGLPTPQKAIKFTYNDDRARFFAKPDLLNIGAKFSRRLMLHELAHRLEYRCPEISIANKQWVAARAAQAQFQAAVPLQELVPKGKYAEDEKAFPDHFVDPYVGKQYADMATEVLSVGLEHLADAKGLVRLYRQDSEHFFLTLGALQAAQSKLAKDLAW